MKEERGKRRDESTVLSSLLSHLSLISHLFSLISHLFPIANNAKPSSRKAPLTINAPLKPM